MGRRCFYPGCKNTTGLHRFPTDFKIRHKWLLALGLSDCEPPPRAGVCNRHFSSDCFSNQMEMAAGFTKVLLLKSDAVPSVAVPQPSTRAAAKPRLILPAAPLHIEPKGTTEIGIQTDPVITKHAFGQANILPIRRSKAIQARAPHRSVWCETDVPQASFIPVKRTKCELSTEDSSYQSDVTDSTMNCSSTLNELPPHTLTKYVVHEDKLMELFQGCPVCTHRCAVSKTITGTFLQVKQSCTYCEYSYQWSSGPASRW